MSTETRGPTFGGRAHRSGRFCLAGLLTILFANGPARANTGSCDDLDATSLRQALEQSRTALTRQPKKALVRAGTHGDYVNRVLTPLLQVIDAGGDLCRYANQYRFTQLGRPGQVLITGYHTPTVAGSLQPTEQFRWPLYRRPPELAACKHGASGCPSYPSAAILAGAFQGRGLELVWLADPYDVFALHIEGSAHIDLTDGSSLLVGTDGHNGLPYQNVSKLLTQDGKMPSGPTPPSDRPGNPKARKYFAEHPDELPVYWGRSPHYVFFKRSDGIRGKLGPLTAERSVAIDTHLVPLGAVLMLQGQKPIIAGGRITGWTPFSRLVVAQDTGSAIVSEERVDLYFGEDMNAQIAATGMSSKGSLYLLLPP